MNVTLQVGNTILDMFGDETIVTLKSVQDARDISTAFSDHTQPFSVPASPANNKVFSHYYDLDVDGTFSQHRKAEAILSFDGIEILLGTIELLGADIKNGKPNSYNIVFYGVVTTLSSEMSENSLSNIDWSAYDHTLDYLTIKSSWNRTLYSGDIVYPLFDSGRDWIWSTGEQKNPRNINVSIYDTNNDGTEVYSGIIIDELKPAIRLPQMIRTIFSNYGYTIDSDFLDDADTQAMYVHLQKDAGKGLLPDSGFNGNIKYDGNATLPTTGDVYTGINLTTLDYDSSNSFNVSTQEFTAQYTGLHSFVLNGEANNFSGNITANYKVQRNGINAQTQGKVSLSGSSKTWNWKYSIYLKQGDTLKWFTRMNFGVFTNNNIDTTLTLTDIDYNRYGEMGSLSQYMPNVKVEEFVSKFLKMFNLVLEPLEGKVIKIEPVEDWFDGGVTYDFNEFIDVTSKDVGKVAPFKTLEFKHAEDESKSASLFKKIASRTFGDLEYEAEVDYGVDKLSIESPFIVPVPEAINALDANGNYLGGSTGIITHKYVDEGGSPIGDALTLAYYNGVETSNSYYLQDGLLNGIPQFNQESTFPNFSIFNENTPITSNTTALSYEQEQPFNASDLPENTLFNRFWGGYIANIYSNNTKLLSVESILPLGIFLNLRLRDSISYDGQLFTINNLSYDFLTEKAKLELVTRDLTKKGVNTITHKDPNTGEVTFKTTPTNRDLRNSNAIKGVDGKYYWEDFSPAVGSKQAELESSTTGLSNTALETFVSKAGDTMTGALILDTADPQTDYTAVTKKYVDDSVSGAGGGDMLKTVYDPEGINTQMVGVDSSQSLLNKTINGVVLNSAGSSTKYLNEDGQYVSIAGGGDMNSSVYDPQGIADDAFDVDNHTDGTTNKVFTSLDNTKLDGIEPLAEVNNISDTNATDLTDGLNSSLHYHSTDRDRANHTGTQTSSTISNFATSVSTNSSVLANTNHRGRTDNPHNITKVQLGLGSVDNTSDLDKPISTATQTALDLKATTSSLADVATSGDYTDLVNKPTTITAAQASDIASNKVKINDAETAIILIEGEQVVQNTNIAAKVDLIEAGTGISVDNTFPTTPVISAKPTTTAGVLNRVYFTADSEVLSTGTYYQTNRVDRGTAASAVQSVSPNDNQTLWYPTDFISALNGVDTTIYGGVYSGGLKVAVDSDRNGNRFYVEAYLADGDGTPIDSGIVGEPVGNLGVRPLAASNTGILEFKKDEDILVDFSGTIKQSVQILATQRVRYHVGAEKVGTSGGTQVMELKTGTNYLSYVDTPLTLLASDIVNDSNAMGASVKDVLNTHTASITANTSDIANLSVDVVANGSDIQTNGVNIAANTAAIITNATTIANLNGTNIPTSGGSATSITDALNQLDVDVANAVKRQNHTGTQLASTISDFEPAVRATIDNIDGIDDGYQVAATDINATLVNYTTDDINVVLPSNTTEAIDIGFRCTIIQANSGSITIQQGSLVTIISVNNAIETTSQGSMVHVVKVGANTWCISGDLQ